MSIVEVLFTLIALSTVVGYGILVWLGMSPERALGFIVGGGVVIGLLMRAAIGVVTPGLEIVPGLEDHERREGPALPPSKGPIPGGKPSGGARN